MADDLAALRRDLAGLLDDTEPLQHAVGMFGKEQASDVVSRTLGGDMQFSGLARKVKLASGYDTGSPVVLNLRPAGLWVLADKGRKRSGRIVPKKRGGKLAVTTPRGPRRSSTYGPSRGLDAIKNTEDAIDRGIVDAVLKGLNSVLAPKGY